MVKFMHAWQNSKKAEITQQQWGFSSGTCAFDMSGTLIGQRVIENTRDVLTSHHLYTT